MTENLLLEPQYEPQDTGFAETNAYCVECGVPVTDCGPAFAHDNDNCALVMQPGFMLREMAHLAARVFPPAISMQIDVPAELWPIRGDHGEIHQALTNVLLSARATLSERGHLVIAARNVTVHEVPGTPFFDAQAGDYVEIAVGDTCSDIDQDLAGLGIGLGLARVVRVLRNHGGFARIESRASQGTTVFLHFPRAVLADAPSNAVAGPAQPPAGSILIVEDEDTILELSRLILARAGYEVLVARDGREALELFEQQRSKIRLVLTDLEMPDMNGITLVWALRRSKPDLHAIVTTGQGTENDLHELERLGVRQVLRKPFSSLQLVDAVSLTLREPVLCEPDLFLS